MLRIQTSLLAWLFGKGEGHAAFRKGPGKAQGEEAERTPAFQAFFAQLAPSWAKPAAGAERAREHAPAAMEHAASAKAARTLRPGKEEPVAFSAPKNARVEAGASSGEPAKEAAPMRPSLDWKPALRWLMGQPSPQNNLIERDAAREGTRPVLHEGANRPSRPWQPKLAEARGAVLNPMENHNQEQEAREGAKAAGEAAGPGQFHRPGRNRESPQRVPHGHAQTAGHSVRPGEFTAQGVRLVDGKESGSSSIHPLLRRTAEEGRMVPGEWETQGAEPTLYAASGQKEAHPTVPAAKTSGASRVAAKGAGATAERREQDSSQAGAKAAGAGGEERAAVPRAGIREKGMEPRPFLIGEEAAKTLQGLAPQAQSGPLKSEPAQETGLTVLLSESKAMPPHVQASSVGSVRAHESFSRQLEAALLQAVQQMPRSLVVRLEPQSLGEMTLQVALEGERIAARISVESEAVAALIQDAKPELDQQMRGRGFLLEQLEVRQDCGQQGQAQQRPTERQATNAAVAEKGSGLRRQEPTAALPQPGSSLPWGVDLLA